MNLTEKATIVTGAGRGIGREITLQLAGRGADIAAVDVDIKLAEETAALARELGLPLDTPKRKSMRSLGVQEASSNMPWIISVHTVIPR